MITGRNSEMQLPEPKLKPKSPSRKSPTGWYWLASRLCGRKAVNESVATRVHVNASPEAVWNHILFYEEIPGRAPFLLRALLPHPVRTEGDKTSAGATVRCTYKGGDLVKRITSVEPPRFLQFEVIEQHLGIESCALALGGSYQIRASGSATDVILITNYLAYLHPRFLWRPLEALLVKQLHRHILHGVRADLLAGNPAVRPAVVESATP
jgi:hypothetical protein